MTLSKGPPSSLEPKSTTPSELEERFVSEGPAYLIEDIQRQCVLRTSGLSYVVSSLLTQVADSSQKIDQGKHTVASNATFCPLLKPKSTDFLGNSMNDFKYQLHKYIWDALAIYLVNAPNSHQQNLQSRTICMQKLLDLYSDSHMQAGNLVLDLVISCLHSWIPSKSFDENSDGAYWLNFLEQIEKLYQTRHDKKTFIPLLMVSDEMQHIIWSWFIDCLNGNIPKDAYVLALSSIHVHFYDFIRSKIEQGFSPSTEDNEFGSIFSKHEDTLSSLFKMIEHHDRYTTYPLRMYNSILLTLRSLFITQTDTHQSKVKLIGSIRGDLILFYYNKRHQSVHINNDEDDILKNDPCFPLIWHLNSMKSSKEYLSDVTRFKEIQTWFSLVGNDDPVLGDVGMIMSSSSLQSMLYKSMVHLICRDQSGLKDHQDKIILVSKMMLLSLLSQEMITKRKFYVPQSAALEEFFTGFQRCDLDFIAMDIQQQSPEFYVKVKFILFYCIHNLNIELHQRSHKKQNFTFDLMEWIIANVNLVVIDPDTHFFETFTEKLIEYMNFDSSVLKFIAKTIPLVMIDMSNRYRCDNSSIETSYRYMIQLLRLFGKLSIDQAKDALYNLGIQRESVFQHLLVLWQKKKDQPSFIKNMEWLLSLK